jgi:hypothetical protein
MNNDSLKRTASVMEGLEWRDNFVALQDDHMTYVIESPGGGATDILFYTDDDPEGWYGLHVGQVDRLTFLGNPTNVIYGSFIDCRSGSPTLHHRVDIRFHPDPTRQLFIDRGIAHHFAGMKNITVRVENLWFMSESNPDYDLSNDVITFRGDMDPKDFPVVTVNDLPVPEAVLKYVVKQQQGAISTRSFYQQGISNRIKLGKQTFRVCVTHP